MDPFCIGSVCIELSLELGSVIVAAVGALATLLHHVHHQQDLRQREQHYQEWRGMQREQGTPLRPPLDLVAPPR